VKATDRIPAIIYFKPSYNLVKYILEEEASAILRVEGGNMLMRNMDL